MLLVLMLGSFTTSLNLTLLAPLLPEIGRSLDVSTAAAGQLSTAGSLAASAAAFLFVPWMDRYSRRAWLRFEASLLIAGSLLSAVAPSFIVLVLGRMVAGVGSAVLGATCFAAIADLLPEPARRNWAMGMVASAFTLGTVVGLPFVTLLNETVGWRWAMLVPAALAVALIAGSRVVPGTSAPRSVPAAGWTSGYAAVLHRSATRWTLGMIATLMAVWFGWSIFLAAAAEEGFGVGAGLLSLLFIVSGIAEIIGNTLAPMLIRQWSPRVVAGAASGILAASLLGVGILFRTGPSLIVFVAFASAASAALFLSGSILLMESSHDARGAAMALQSTAVQLGGAIGVAVTGAAISVFDSYPAAYRLLGCIAPIALICLLASSRGARSDVLEADAVTA